MSEVIFSEIDLEDFNIEYKEDSHRLYVKREGDYFSAIAFHVIGNPCSCLNGCGETTLEVKKIFAVTAYFDGVRHVNFGSGDVNDGYFYYPNMKCISEMLSKVREIELEICSDCEK